MKDLIIDLAKQVAERNFMLFPDYDREVKLNLADALVILIECHVDPKDEQPGGVELYDYLNSVINA